MLIGTPLEYAAMVLRRKSLSVGTISVLALAVLGVGLSFAQPPDKPYEDFELFYATNRMAEKRKSAPDGIRFILLSPGFGAGRGRLSYGTAVVTLPDTRKFGDIPSPEAFWIFRYRSFDFAKHSILFSTTPRSAGQFYERINARIAARNSKQAIIFIHGYNSGFDDYFLSLASASKDLDVPVVLFSWPSAGRLSRYKSDVATASWAQVDFSKFLIEFSARTRVESVTLVAHSMGSRILVETLTALDRAGSLTGTPIKRVIFVAPDLDIPRFREFVDANRSSGREIDLFIRGNDLALRASWVINRKPRLGAVAAEDAIFPGVTTIDLSSVALTMALDTGHRHHHASIYVALMAKKTDKMMTFTHPGGSFRFEAVEAKNGRYWKFLPE